MPKKDNIKIQSKVLANALIILGFIAAFVSLIFNLGWQFFLVAPLLMIFGLLIYLFGIDKQKRNFYIKRILIIIFVFFILNEINRMFLKFGTFGYTIIAGIIGIVAYYFFRTKKDDKK